MNKEKRVYFVDFFAKANAKNRETHMKTSILCDACVQAIKQLGLWEFILVHSRNDQCLASAKHHCSHLSESDFEQLL